MEQVDQESTSQNVTPELNQCDHKHNSDPMLCYCYRYTVNMVKEAHAKAGSVKAMQEQTKIGNACGGCRVLLHTLFNEAPSDINSVEAKPTFGSACSKPGSRVMKGLVIANEHLDSVIYSSNAVAPQLGECDASMPIQYALVDHRAQPIIVREAVVKTNEIFIFDTRKENIPRPFIGMFLYGIGRSNYGSSRFNIHWTNGFSSTATHENNDTGRPRVFLPLPVDQKFINGDTSVFMAIMNPQQERVPFKIEVFNLDEPQQRIVRDGYLDSFHSTWIDMNEYLFKPALALNPHGRFSMMMESSNMNTARALTEYFFFYNKRTNVWTSNHL